MIINIQGTGIELTDALKQYAEEKIQGLTKFFTPIQQADIDIGLTTNHHSKGAIYYAEVNLHVPQHLVRVSKKETDLYKAIDKVKDHLKVELVRLKGKQHKKDRDVVRDTKGYIV